MPSLDDILGDLSGPPEDAAYQGPPPKAVKHPPGWEPHVVERGGTATAVSAPTDDPDPDETKLIQGWGLDPSEWQIIGPLNCRRWQVNAGGGNLRWLYYYKADLQRRGGPEGLMTGADVDALVSAASKIQRHKRPPPDGDHSLIVNVADWQVGCGDGDGTPGTAARVLSMWADVADRVRTLRKSGVDIGSIHLAGMGDLGEGVCGFYDQQTYTVDLNLREQQNVIVNLLLAGVRTLAPLVPRLVLLACGGNHGEQRTGKQSGGMTDDADNRDVAAFDMLRLACAENADLDHVKFVIPRDELAVTLEVAGTPVAWTHGHLYRSPEKVWKWWKDLAFADGPTDRYGLDQARILNAGHFHHLIMKEPTAGRMFFQSPPMDGGSKYFADRHGGISAPGTVTYTVGPDGWDNFYLARARTDWRDAAPKDIRKLLERAA